MVCTIDLEPSITLYEEKDDFATPLRFSVQGLDESPLSVQAPIGCATRTVYRHAYSERYATPVSD
jgi:hypothetical protein